ncbi:MAG: hypothetical protein H6822_26645 [Planctomycetaceae bacterium]|nr:hypothetical protein [Planctomycetales bacterium]MCB9925758.1 hypothetical protein [Planctomycetaceae bacterium]
MSKSGKKSGGSDEGKKKLAPPGKGYHLIWRASITTKSGKKIYASQCGIKAFPIWVKD